MKRPNAAAWLMCSTLFAAPCVFAAQHVTAPAPPQQANAPVAPGLAAAENALNGKTYTVPAGTKVLLSLKSGVNTKTARPGDGVYLVSTFPVIVGSHVLIPSGVYVQGIMDKVDRPGRIKGRAKLLMHFTTMIFPNGQVVGIPGHGGQSARLGRSLGQRRRGHDRAGEQQRQGTLATWQRAA